MKKIALGSALVLVLALAGIATAGTICLTLPEFSSDYHAEGDYYDPYIVGAFTFDLTGYYIVSATISGQWGNSEAYTTAHNLLFVDGLQVASTYDYDPDPYFNGPTLWSYVFSDFSTLEDGEAVFSTVQLTQYYVRLGETTLCIETTPIPVPPAVVLMGTGLVALLGARRRFFP